MTNNRAAIRFIQELRSENSKELLESLSNLLEVLENTNDPNPIEMSLVDHIYQLLEKVKSVEGILHAYLGENNIPTKRTNVLEKLYEEIDRQPGYYKNL